MATQFPGTVVSPNNVILMDKQAFQEKWDTTGKFSGKLEGLPNYRIRLSLQLRSMSEKKGIAL